MDNFAIEAKDICISFNGNQILYDVNFSVKKGEVHALIGTNGAGKSTLVKIINGVYRKDSGELSVFGIPSDYNSPDGALKAGIAMVFQDLSLIPTMNVSENIFLKMNPYRKAGLIDDRKNASRTRELLEMIGIENEIEPDDLVSSLSTGQQQLVEIAKALSNDPKILILDEPTASLSNAEIERLFRVVDNLKNQGITIIYITHYLKDIFKICDAVTLIRDGRIAFTRDTADIDLQFIVDQMTNSLGGKYHWNRDESKRSGVPLLEVRNLNTEKITDVSFSVYKGEIVGIAGLLGSGRTELFRALFGIDRISSGDILVEGKPIRIASSSSAIANGITLVPENRREEGLVLDFSVSENTIMQIYGKIKKRLFWIDEKLRKSITEQYIGKFGIKTQGSEQIVRYLSGGNQQKVVVAKCLATNSEILLLDDPTFGVDIQAKHEIMKIIDDYAKEGNSVIMVSSEFNEIADFCDSIYIMRRGTITDLISERSSEDQLLYLVQ